MRRCYLSKQENLREIVHKRSGCSAHAMPITTKLTSFPVMIRLRFGLYYVVFYRIFVTFKNVIHNFEPGWTPSFSASHEAPNYLIFFYFLLDFFSCKIMNVQFTYSNTSRYIVSGLFEKVRCNQMVIWSKR